MPIPDAPFVFVSYSSEDKDVVHREIRRLKKLGCKVWYDSEGLEPALFWDDEINKAIRACACFVVFITRDALSSAPVLREINLALEVGKPFISIYWEKVELPTELKEPIRRRQALQRYALHNSEYEEPLMRALGKYVKIEPLLEENNDTSQIAPVAMLPPITSDVLPKVVFFGLRLLGVLAFLLAVMAFLTPYFFSGGPNDPPGNRLGELVTSIFFVAIAFSLGGGAFAVHRIYLRKKHG